MGAEDAIPYSGTVVDWDRLNELARRVARETQAPRARKDVTTSETRKRTVPGGFLNLGKRVEHYQVETTQSAEADHWVLARRYWDKVAPFGGYFEASHNRMEYCLGANGDLFVRMESWEEVDSQQAGVFVQYSPTEVTKSSLRDVDVENLDHKPEEYHRNDGTRVDTDRDPSDELLFGAKGDGLAALLENLRAKAG